MQAKFSETALLSKSLHFKGLLLWHLKEKKKKKHTKCILDQCKNILKLNNTPTHTL